MPAGRQPRTACSVWIAALALRAVLVVGLALAALLLLPATELFQHVAAWSAHLRAGSGEVQLSGEPVAHLAALGPPAADPHHEKLFPDGGNRPTAAR